MSSFNSNGTSYSGSPTFLCFDHRPMRHGVTISERRIDVSRRAWLNCAMLLVGIVGLSITLYLSWASLSGSKLAGCGGGQLFDCNHVIQTKWSTAFGVPVGIPAAFLYLSLIVGLVISMVAQNENLIRAAFTVVTLCAMATAIAAIWFVFLQLFVVEHWCAYCLAAHACGLILVAIVLWGLPLGRSTTRKLSLLSLAGVSVVALGQFLAAEPQSFQIENHTLPVAPANDQGSEQPKTDVFHAPGFAPTEGNRDTGDNSDANVNVFEAPIVDDQLSKNSRQNMRQSNRSNATMAQLSPATQQAILITQVAGESLLQQEPDDPSTPAKESNLTEPRRLVLFSGGKVQLDADHWPMVGAKSAELIFVEMFDYTCPHCRANHKSVKAALKELKGKAAVIVISVPLNRRCNPSVRTTHAQHREACDLSRLSVAVWRADEVKFAEFHDWLFSGETAPTTTAANQKAAELVGTTKLHKELGGEVVSQYVAKQVELYKILGAGTVPKLLFPGTSVSGKIVSADLLVHLLRQQLDERQHRTEQKTQKGMDK